MFPLFRYEPDIVYLHYLFHQSPIALGCSEDDGYSNVPHAAPLRELPHRYPSHR